MKWKQCKLGCENEQVGKGVNIQPGEVLLNAMKFAQINQKHIEGLRKKLGLTVHACKAKVHQHNVHNMCYVM